LVLVVELCSPSSIRYLGMTNSLAFRSLSLAVKSVRQKQKPSVELLWLLDEFRRMVNVCIAIGIEENVSSLKTLSLRSYHRLSREMLGYYRLGAIGTRRRNTSQLPKSEEEESSYKNPMGQETHADHLLRVQGERWPSQATRQTATVHLSQPE
jgi:hypothetical protein